AYRNLPFWLASLVDRIVIVLVPLAVVLLPGLKVVPWLYKWRINARIYRRYAELMALERVAFSEATPKQRADVLKRLDEIERRIVSDKLPPSAAEQLYVLRQHIHFVRNRLLQEAPSSPAPAGQHA
ncbi:MAG TPA: C4-dicarboxylate ABC transporter substrate-binding protein, partial [Burkholderiales bacterium]|nr:C4-dicarboxylate ABC transporter substrate-binding protein [Burkholderiales bacterium]